MRILLTNDDGIFAPGLAALYRALADMGALEVVAPATEQTGVGHGITVGRPMLTQRTQVRNAFEGWSVDGRPADCVKLAVLKLLEQRPHFVISGINAGLNTGPYVLYSGTVAAAAEAAVFFGIPALAVSLQLSETPDFDRAARVARQVIERFAAANPRPGTCLNVSIPAVNAGWPRGTRTCPHTTDVTGTRYREEIDADGRRIFRFDGGDPEQTCQAGTDAEAIRDGYVAVTPLQFDRTHQEQLAEFASWDWPARFD